MRIPAFAGLPSASAFASPVGRRFFVPARGAWQRRRHRLRRRPFRTMAEDDAQQQKQQQEYLDHINSENELLEAEIARLTQEKMAQTKPLAATKTVAEKAPGSGICVLDFGSLDHAEAAGIDRGSAWRPAQTRPRTLNGGFFTS